MYGEQQKGRASDHSGALLFSKRALHMNDYDELAGQAERGELPVISGTALVGAAAAAAGQQMLLDATGASNLEEATQIAGRRGITKSRVIREAVEEYLRAHA